MDERAAAKSVSSHGTTRFADQHRGRQAEGVSCNLAATSFETPAQRHATGPTVSSRLRRTMSAGRLQRTRESSSARSPSNAENPVPCNTSWFKTDLNSPGYATLSLKMGYSKERAHVPWAGPDKALHLIPFGDPQRPARAQDGLDDGFSKVEDLEAPSHLLVVCGLEHERRSSSSSRHIERRFVAPEVALGLHRVHVRRVRRLGRVTRRRLPVGSPSFMAALYWMFKAV